MQTDDRLTLGINVQAPEPGIIITPTAPRMNITAPERTGEDENLRDSVRGFVTHTAITTKNGITLHGPGKMHKPGIPPVDLTIITTDTLHIPGRQPDLRPRRIGDNPLKAQCCRLAPFAISISFFSGEWEGIAFVFYSLGFLLKQALIFLAFGCRLDRRKFNQK
jgi:hypothetical protein